MKILFVGLGVIGSTYGYIFKKSGAEVEHFIRKESKNFSINELKIDLLDGRTDKKGKDINDIYQVTKRTTNTKFDIIFVSVPEGGIQEVVDSLKAERIEGTILLACGIWENKDKLNEMMSGYKYILGYPVAGGNKNKDVLTCCLFDNFMLESKEKSDIPNYDDFEKLFASSNITLEKPYDMLEWIWLHMAINAGVTSTAGKYGDINNTSIAAEQLMNSSKQLSEVILTIRETCKIIESRGLNLKNYRNEIFAYYFPSKIAGLIMKKMFAGNILTRKIMTLHNDIKDLIFVCQKCYECAEENQIDAPRFKENYNAVMKKYNS